MRTGSAVKLPSGEIGIVVRQCEGFLDVLLDDYSVLSVERSKVSETGKYFDMSIVWEMVK